MPSPGFAHEVDQGSIRGKHDTGTKFRLLAVDGASNPKGYGYLYTGERTDRAHRYSWELYNERKIPKGMYICHACDVKLCVNPDHLWLGTPTENTIDAFKKGLINRPYETHRNARKTHCPKGHPYSGDNVRYAKSGRVCRICKDEHNRLRPSASAIRSSLTDVGEAKTAESEHSPSTQNTETE